MAADLDIDLRDLVGDVPYGLLDGAGRATLLQRLVTMLAGAEEPLQIWHGADRRPQSPGADAASVLRRELAANARGRLTLLRSSASPTTTVVVTEDRTFVQLDDTSYARVIALTSWPATVTPNWLADLADKAAGVSVNLRPLSGDVAARLLRRRLSSLSSSEAVDEQAGRVEDPALQVAADAARDLGQAVARNATQLLHVQVLIRITAATIDELDEHEQELHATARRCQAALTPLQFEQRPAWAATCPDGSPLRWPWRLLDAASAAATVPLPAGPRSSAAAGTLVGVDPTSGVPVSVDRFALHNPTRLVLGTSGAGKSYAAKLELIRQVVTGTHAVVIDPEGEFGPLVDALGGLSLAVGEEPAGLDPVGLACRPGLAPTEGLSVLTAWASALLGTALSPVDLALLDRALGVLRADRVSRPTAADLLAVIADIAAHPPFHGSDLTARLAPATGGSLADLFAPNPDLASAPALVAFDLRGVPDRARPAVMACVLAWAWTQAVDAGSGQRQLLVVDEAHLLLDDPAAAAILVQFARRARKYGVALDVVTQRLSDFLGHPAGEAVLANAATKLLLGCEDHEHSAVTSGLGLTEAEGVLLRPGTRGSGLLIAPHLRTAIDVVAAPAEHVLACSGPR